MSEVSTSRDLAETLFDILSCPELTNEEATIALDQLSDEGVGPADTVEAARLALARYCFQVGKLVLSVSPAVVPLMEAVA